MVSLYFSTPASFHIRGLPSPWSLHRLRMRTSPWSRFLRALWRFAFFSFRQRRPNVFLFLNVNIYSLMMFDVIIISSVFPKCFCCWIFIWIFQIMMMSEFCVHDSTHYVRVSKVKVIKNMLCFLTQVPSTPGLFWQLFEAWRPKDFGLLRWCIPLFSNNSWPQAALWDTLSLFFATIRGGHKRSWFDQQIVWIPCGRWTLLAMERDTGNGGLHRLQSTGMLKYMGHIICQVSTCIYADTCIRERHRKTQTNQVFKTRLR